jgi:tRNA threonylcarbamoyladenosine modification (KEOPS) complex  Pcc1 subunit
LIGATAVLELSADGLSAEDLMRTLEPELRSEIVGRGVDLQAKDNTVILRIRSDNIPDMRAALNSYLHWFHSIGEVGRILGKARK